MKNNSFLGRVVLAALLLFSLFISSCGPKIEYREDTIRPVTYEIITANGLKRWGMVNYMDGRVIERYTDEMLFDGNPVNKIMNSNDLYKKYSNSTYGKSL